jgi:hypothetical protein
MKKDIFIDANIASKFANTTDEKLLELINWLIEKKNESYLMMSDYLRIDMFKGNAHCPKEFSICNVIYKLQRDERLNFKDKNQIKEFQTKNFSGKIWKKLSCKTNKKGDPSNDPHHIALIFLSDRRFAITEDNNLLNDLLTFPMKGIQGKNITAVKKPQDVNYKENETA